MNHISESPITDVEVFCLEPICPCDRSLLAHLLLGGGWGFPLPDRPCEGCAHPKLRHHFRGVTISEYGLQQLRGRAAELVVDSARITCPKSGCATKYSGSVIVGAGQCASCNYPLRNHLIEDATRVLALVSQDLPEEFREFPRFI